MTTSLHAKLALVPPMLALLAMGCIKGGDSGSCDEALESTTLELQQSASATTSVDFTKCYSGSTEDVFVTVQDAPSELSAILEPDLNNPLRGTIMIEASLELPVGTYQINVKAFGYTQGGSPKLDANLLVLVTGEDCFNGIDDDDDGQIDCDDSNCGARAACQGIEECTNGRDDDNDGAADCADSDCGDLPVCSQGTCGDVSPGDGFFGASCSRGADCQTGNCCVDEQSCETRNRCTCRHN